MAITGNLRTMVLSELLQWLSLGQKTGTLVISGRGVEKRIYLHNGRIAYSSSSDQREYLGHFLLSHGYITEEELKMAIQVQEESSILLGKILVMINAISETDLVGLMRKKAEESIYEIFLWDEGEFEFFDNEIPEQKMIPLAIDVTGIIMEGVRRHDEWARILEQVGSTQAVPRLAGNITVNRYSDRDKLILPYVDGRRSIAEIAVQTHNSDFIVAQFVARGLREETMTIVALTPTAPAPLLAAAVGDDMDNLLRRGLAAREDNPVLAWRLFKAASELDPADGRPRDALRRVEESLRSALLSDGIELSKVPCLRLDYEEITRLNCTPNEGFVLSRINGTWDVKSISQISPIREIEVLMIMRKFLLEGVIAWKK
jgi:hypothetical protein